MGRTLDLYNLIQQPESQRDEEWEQAFFHAFLAAKVEIDGEESRVGPDGWPYLFVKTSREATEPAGKVMQWLMPRGIGLVVNAHKMLPDYVFPYGMIWHFVETGQFITSAPVAEQGAVVLQKGQKLLYGPPSDQYLPRYVRDVMREFLKAQGFSSPKVLVITSPDYKQVDLAFSLESLNNPESAHHQALAEALAWFLPLHYTLVLASEANMPSFSDL